MDKSFSEGKMFCNFENILVKISEDLGNFCLSAGFHHVKVLHKKFLEQIMRYKVA